MSYKLVSKYVPTGDQPEAIEQLVNGVHTGEDAQVLLGVTGSGKTFTIANVISQLDRNKIELEKLKNRILSLMKEKHENESKYAKLESQYKEVETFSKIYKKLPTN